MALENLLGSGTRAEEINTWMGWDGWGKGNVAIGDLCYCLLRLRGRAV